MCDVDLTSFMESRVFTLVIDTYDTISMLPFTSYAMKLSRVLLVLLAFCHFLSVS